jgi:hypothetical protein
MVRPAAYPPNFPAFERFEAVVSNLTIRNIANAVERVRARKIAYVLKDEGSAALRDFCNVSAHAQTLRKCGLLDVHCQRSKPLMFADRARKA